MTTAEILAQLPGLSRQDRRKILDRLLEIEDVAEVLESSRRMADEAFQILDAMEAVDATANPGEVWIVNLGLAAKVRPCVCAQRLPGRR